MTKEVSQSAAELNDETSDEVHDDEDKVSWNELVMIVSSKWLQDLLFKCSEEVLSASSVQRSDTAVPLPFRSVVPDSQLAIARFLHEQLIVSALWCIQPGHGCW